MDSEPSGRQGQMRQKRPTLIDDDAPFKDDDDDMLEDSAFAAATFLRGRATTQLSKADQDNLFDRLEQRNPQDSIKVTSPNDSIKCNNNFAD